jgi:hypothetical protein
MKLVEIWKLSLRISSPSTIFSHLSLLERSPLVKLVDIAHGLHRLASKPLCTRLFVLWAVVVVADRSISEC